MVVRNVLTIAGTDPTGGAGIQADLKAFSAHGVFGMSVVTAVVAQNTRGVRRFVVMDSGFVADQLAAVFDDVRVDAVKIGMVANADIVGVIADALDRYPHGPVVLDPVMVAKSGDHLLDPDAVAALRNELVPRATVITPNLPEAAVLINAVKEPADLAQMRAMLPALRRLGSEWVLLKGGHLSGALSVDLLSGLTELELPAPRIETVNDHGTGCTLSSALAALLTESDVATAVRGAKEYLTEALRHADELDVGSGHGPVNHFHALWESR